MFLVVALWTKPIDQYKIAAKTNKKKLLFALTESVTGYIRMRNACRITVYDSTAVEVYVRARNSSCSLSDHLASHPSELLSAFWYFSYFSYFLVSLVLLRSRILVYQVWYARISLALLVPWLVCGCFGFLCLTICDHIICISLGWRISTDTGCDDVIGYKGQFNVKTTHTGTLGLRSTQSFRLLVLEVYSRVLRHFSSWYSRDSRVLSHFSLWHSKDSLLFSHFSLWNSRYSRLLNQ